jgi:hypothetical protein
MENNMKKHTSFIVLFLIILLLVSCSAPSASIPATAVPTLTPTPTALPTNTLAPTPIEISSIPGFEDWSVLKRQAIEIATENGSLVLTLKQHALWFMEQRGVLVYKLVDGDFKITATLHTAKSSDPSQSPGGDGTVQLGGLMARNGKGGQENYVFIVIGDDGDGLSVETKNTTDSFSKYSGPAWDSADAELRLCRLGQMFNLYKRHVGSSETWTLAATFDRPDLPDALQVGVNIYTDSEPDLQIRYENISIKPVTSETECDKD